MNTFPDITLNIGEYVAAFVRFLVDNFGVIFDAIRDFFSAILINLQDFLIWLPWWAFLIIIFLLGWRFKSLGAGILFAGMLFLVGTFGMWEELMVTIAIVLTAVIISLIIGIPLGILMAYSKPFSMVTRPVLDAMQTMPSFVYLIPAIFFFGLGNVPGIFATLIYALPPVIRLTELALRNVDPEVIESAESFGSSKRQMLMKVQLPQALPTIMAGVNQTTMMALAMVVIASMVGAQGLGEQVLIAINRIDIALGFEAGISIVFLAIIIDRVSGGIVERFQKHRGTE